VLVLAVPASAGDEAIARRLAAFAALVDPAAAREAGALDSDGACPTGSWWRITEYGLRARMDRAIRDASLRFAVDRRLIRAVIRHESGFDPDAVSSRGARGLMQLMPATAGELRVRCPVDPRENVLGGTRYLRRLRDRLGSWPRAIAAYHAGPGRVEAGRIPAETRRYVERVLRSWRRQ
jgi:soluble lytic murein transglycosylase-like protein